jgi:hypothetical protein
MYEGSCFNCCFGCSTATTACSCCFVCISVRGEARVCTVEPRVRADAARFQAVAAAADMLPMAATEGSC